MQQLLTIGSRGSPLALVQARHVQSLLALHVGIDASDVDLAFPILIFKTTGDRLTGRLALSGGKGLFVKELDEALADGRIDLAVHSMKDVPTHMPDVFKLAAILPREDVRDAFISLTATSFMDLPSGASLGTASLRRQAQAARLRPDLKISLLRGNVGTRLAKLEAGECDATFLAAAGLNRLGQTDVITHLVETCDMLPAPAQGAVGVQIRSDDEKVLSYVAPLDDPATDICITAERALLKSLDGSCRTPIAALAQLDGTHLRLRAQALTPDGQISFERDTVIALGDAPKIDAYALGYSLGSDIRLEAGEAIQWDMPEMSVGQT